MGKGNPTVTILSLLSYLLGTTDHHSSLQVGLCSPTVHTSGKRHSSELTITLWADLVNGNLKKPVKFYTLSSITYPMPYFDKAQLYASLAIVTFSPTSSWMFQSLKSYIFSPVILTSGSNGKIMSHRGGLIKRKHYPNCAYICPELLFPVLPPLPFLSRINYLSNYTITIVIASTTAFTILA